MGTESPYVVGETCVVLRTLFSAGTYLFSLGTSIYAMVEYYKEYFKYKPLCDVSCPNFSCGDKSYLCLRAHDARFFAIFASCLFIFAHTVNAFFFAFKFEKGEAPIKSAYFLPLIQLWRLVNLMKETWSCRGFKDFFSEEKNTLFTQLSLSLETLPMYSLQLYAWEFKLKQYVNGSVMLAGIRALLISTVSSFLSSFFMGGLTVLATAKNVTSLKLKSAVGICSGLCISTEAYLRYSSLVNLYYQRGTIDRIKIYQGKKSSNMLHLQTVNILLSPLKWVCYTVFFLICPANKAKTMRDRGFTKAIALAYISNNVGPLYALVSEALEQDQLGAYNLRIKLLVVGLFNLIVDCLIVPDPRRFILQPDFLVSAGIYIASIVVYVIVDKRCGKPIQLPSQLSTQEQNND